MTPRASDIYFKLLDSKMEKLAAPRSWWTSIGEMLGSGVDDAAAAAKKIDSAAEAAAKAAPAAANAAAPAAGAVADSGYGLGSLLGAAGLSALGAGAIGHSMAQQEAAAKAKSDKLKYLATGFGGGVATGLAAPSLMGGVNKAIGKLNKIVGNQGFMPSDTYGAYAPELGFYPEQY